MNELAEVLARPKSGDGSCSADVELFVAGILAISEIHPDPQLAPGAIAADPEGDYPVAFAQTVDGVDVLVSGDPHLTDLRDSRPPVFAPRGERNGSPGASAWVRLRSTDYCGADQHERHFPSSGPRAPTGSTPPSRTSKNGS